MNTSEEGKYIYDFLLAHRDVSHSIGKLNFLTKDNYTKLASNRSISLAQLKKALEPEEMLLVYRSFLAGSQNLLIACTVQKLKDQCRIKELNFNFNDISQEFRSDVINYGDGTFDPVSSKKIHDALLVTLTYTRFQRLVLCLRQEILLSHLMP